MSQNFKNSAARSFRGEPSTRALLRQAALNAIGSADVRLEIDAPADLRCGIDSASLVELVTAMVRAAVACLPADGEIILTLWQSDSTCEIEVADNGPAVESRPRRLPLAAAALGAEMVWQNCPQGGAAVTAKLRPWLASREAA